MHPTAYLFFNGQAGEAIALYTEILDAEVAMLMRMSDAPPEMQVPDDRKDWIMHAELGVAGGRLFLSDDFSGNSPAMAGCSVMLEYPSVTEARSVFDRLAEGGNVSMPFEPTFWSSGFGSLTDRFGIQWMIGTTETPS